MEEEYVFPILGNENEYIKKTSVGLRRLGRLFGSIGGVTKLLGQIEEELEHHNRFQERALFNKTQMIAKKKQFLKYITMKDSMTIPMTSSGKNPKIKDFTKVYDNLLTEFKREQTGYVFIAVIMQSCIGAVAAMVLLLDGPTLTNLTLLFVVTMLCMAYNGAVLAQLKSKLTFNLLILSIVFSCAVIVAYLF